MSENLEERPEQAIKPATKPKGKSPGRPKGTGCATADSKMLRVIVTPKQARLLTVLRKSWGLSESEHVRRSLDLYLNGLLASGELVDPGPAAAAADTTVVESKLPGEE